MAASSLLGVSVPQQHTLLLTLNRPSQRNAITPDLAREIAHVLNWFDNEPSLWVVVLTGEGDTFCAGADLKSWHASQSSDVVTEQQDFASSLHGFASISRRRTSLKPIIAAVNGPAYGGGVEIILNCDLVVASTSAVFALPEVKRGVVAAQGGQSFFPSTLGTGESALRPELVWQTLSYSTHEGTNGLDPTTRT